MGSCVSVHKDTDSAMKLRFSATSKHDKLLIPSPVKEKSGAVNGGDRAVAADAAAKPQWSPPRFRDAGSKEEAFFDSQPWLESDNEDDFLSVNGDSTPSRGSTPVHHKFSSGNLPVNKPPIASAVVQSPPDKKKRLSDLFKESLRNQSYEDEEDGASNETMEPEMLKSGPTHLIQPKSTNAIHSLSGTNSGGSSERTSNGAPRMEDENVKSSQCCMPRFRSSSRSFK